MHQQQFPASEAEQT